jgi:hypothetical protein
MQPTKATPSPSHPLSDGFWDRYAARLRAQEVKPTAIRWYVICAAQYLQAVPPAARPGRASALEVLPVAGSGRQSRYVPSVKKAV